MQQDAVRPVGIADFLRFVHQLAIDRDGNYDPDYEVEIRPLGAKSSPRAPYNGFATVDAAAGFAGTMDAVGADGYFGVALRRRGVGKGGDGSVAAFLTAFGDIDCDKHGVTKERAIEAIAACPWGPPSIVVDSGGGLHPYWLYREPLDASNADDVTAHQKTQRFIRWWLNDRLGVDCADDMSSRDRILRLPGTHNQKPERRLPDGTSPLASVLSAPGGFFEPADILAFQPTDTRWDHVLRPSQVLDPDSLPTEVPERIKRVLAAAGLRVKVKRLEGGQIHAMVLHHCPACNDVAGKGRCYITATGRLKTKHGASCPARDSETGGAGLSMVDWVHTYAPQAKGALAVREDVGQQRRPKANRVAIALDELALDTGESLPAEWLRDAGLHPDLIDAAIDRHVVLCPAPAMVDSSASRLAHALAAARRSDDAILPVQDTAGVIRTAMWLSTTGKLRNLDHLQVDSLGDLPEGLGLLGSFPAAVMAGAAGRPVVLVDDPRDWLMAQAASLDGRHDAEAVGVLRSRDLPKLARLLARAWAAAGALPPRVTLCCREESPPDEAALAAKALAGRAGVAVCIPTTRASLGGLSASAADFGVESVLRAVRSAPWRYEPPADIATAGPAIAAFLEQSVAIAAGRSTHKGHKLVIAVIDAGAGKTTTMLRIGARIASGELPMPVCGGKPRNAQDWPPEGRRVGFWLPSHMLAAEKLAQFRGMAGGDADAVHLKGALEWCAFKHHVKEMFPVTGRRGICGDPDTDRRCPEAADGCLGAVEPRIDFGQVAFGPHAMAPNIKQDIAIIDESPGVIESAAVDGAAVASLFTPRILPRVKKWRTIENPDAPIAARLLSDAVQALANAHTDDIGAGRADGYARHVSGDELVATIDGTPGLAEALRIGAHPDARKPPVPFPDEIRSGAFSPEAYPSRRAFDALQSLWIHYARLKGIDQPADRELVMDEAPTSPNPRVNIALYPDRTWAIEKLSIRRLPDCPVVMLDATGEITLDEWKAAYPDRDVVVRRLRVQGTSPALALHLKTKQFSRKSIWTSTGDVSERTAARLRSVITRTVLEARRKATSQKAPGRLTVGVLVYKGIWDLVTGARPPDTPAEAVLAGISQFTGQMDVDVLWGYFGKHDRGTNEFEGVSALATLGDPRENLGAIQLQADLLGLDADRIGRGRTLATLVQSVFRARHTRRGGDGAAAPVVIVHVGERCPDVDGVEWLSEPLVEHKRPATAGKVALAYAVVEYVAEQMEDVVGHKIVQMFDFGGSPFGRDVYGEVSESTWRDACAAYARARSLTAVTVRIAHIGRPVVLYGQTVEAVKISAIQAFGVKTARNIEIIEECRSEAPENDPENGPCAHLPSCRPIQISAQRRGFAESAITRSSCTCARTVEPAPLGAADGPDRSGESDEAGPPPLASTA